MSARPRWSALPPSPAASSTRSRAAAACITFPALVAAGLPPVAASVTNTVAMCPGYFGATIAQRKQLVGQRARLYAVVPAGAVGGIVGALLLLHTGEAAFDVVVPFLLLFAAGMLAGADAAAALARYARGGARRSASRGVGRAAGRARGDLRRLLRRGDGRDRARRARGRARRFARPRQRAQADRVARGQRRGGGRVRRLEPRRVAGGDRDGGRRRSSAA